MGGNFSIFQLCFLPNSVDDVGGHDEDLNHVDVEARIIPRGTLRRFGDNLAISSRARPEWAGEDWPGTGTGPGLLTRVPLKNIYIKEGAKQTLNKPNCDSFNI